MTGYPALQCDVSVTSDLSALVFHPARHTDHYNLVARLRSLVGTARLTAGAVCIPSVAAHSLVNLLGAKGIRWSELAARFVENRARLRPSWDNLREQVAHLKDSGPSLARTLVADLADLHTLDDHQVLNVAAMTLPDSPGLCVFDEQGAGKTVTLIFALDLLVQRREVDIALIVAPKSMVPEWPMDLERFKGDVYQSAVITGSSRRKRSTLCRPVEVFVTNFETAVALEPELTSLAQARDGRCMLVIDESFFVKNLDAQRTRALRRIREWCGRAYVLCGTPAPNRPHDLVQQFNLVDFGSTFDGVVIPEDRDLAAPIVRDAIETRGLYVRHLKRDVLPQLPTRSFSRILCPMQPLQKQIYGALLRNVIIDLQRIDDDGFQRQLTSFLARRTALKQVCSHPAMVTDGYDETPAKLVALDSLLDELVGRRGEKVIVWSYFRHSLQEIAARYSRFGAVRYDGSVTDVAERREAVRRFQEDEETRLFVANPAAAGAGLTLHRARVAVYESLGDQAAHYLQSLDRIHRRGQERDVEYFMLLCDGTIDEVDYDRLLRKERDAQQLLRDGSLPLPTRQGMLDELLSSGCGTRVEASPGSCTRSMRSPDHHSGS